MVLWFSICEWVVINSKLILNELLIYCNIKKLPEIPKRELNLLQHKIQDIKFPLRINTKLIASISF